MTHAQLAKRVAYWCGRLQMDPWIITTSIVDHPHGQMIKGDVAAAVGTSTHYLYAEIEFSTEWVALDLTDDDRDQTIVHELLHCLFRDLDKAAGSMSNLLGPILEDQFDDRYNHELEQLIDRLAHVIVALNTK